MDSGSLPVFPYSVHLVNPVRFLFCVCSDFYNDAAPLVLWSRALRAQGLEFSIVTFIGLGYARAMLWKKSWEPESVLGLIGGIIAAFFFGNIAAGLLRQAGVAGFKTEYSVGSVLAATLSFHGAALALGTGFFRRHGPGWGEALGLSAWKRSLRLAVLAMVAVTPVVLLMNYLSGLALEALHWPVEEQAAVDLILKIKSPWLTAYLGFFAVVLAPIAEEFFFRGILFSSCKRLGWTKTGWLGVSFLFALFHLNAPTFLPLFVLALVLTWLYDRTESLLAPICAHGFFNLINLALLLAAVKYNHHAP
jgi:membrane protease YdiL (CAAX protease family)